MFKAFGLYTQIRQNRVYSVLLLLGFVVLLQALVFAFAIFGAVGYGGSLEMILRHAAHSFAYLWPFAMAGAAVWFLIAFVFQQQLIDMSTGAEDVTREAAPKLYNTLENLCISRGLPMPGLRIIETDGLNAFASGLRESNYSVAVTRGLMDRLTDAELEAVLGHELTHIRNRDTQLMVVALVFAGIFSFIGQLIFNNWGFPISFGRSSDSDDSDRRSSGGGGAIFAIIIALVTILVSWGLSVLIRLALSRRREFLADAGSVELTKNPDAMISALRKISVAPQVPQASAHMSALFIESPAFRPENSLFSTHPSIAARIDALVRYAGGHDVPPSVAVVPDTPLRDTPWGDTPLPPQGMDAPATVRSVPEFLPKDGSPILKGPWRR
jgi:heat shock protein HtpX